MNKSYFELIVNSIEDTCKEHKYDRKPLYAEALVDERGRDSVKAELRDLLEVKKDDE